MELFGSTISSLHNALTYSSVKQNAISDNIANNETPNYKAKEVTFKPYLEAEKLEFQSKKTNSMHLSFPQHTISPNITITSKEGMYNINGNSVDVDKEMALLAENTIYYNAVTDRISGKLNGLMNVIKGGK